MPTDEKRLSCFYLVLQLCIYVNYVKYKLLLQQIVTPGLNQSKHWNSLHGKWSSMECTRLPNKLLAGTKTTIHYLKMLTNIVSTSSTKPCTLLFLLSSLFVSDSIKIPITVLSGLWVHSCIGQYSYAYRLKRNENYEKINNRSANKALKVTNLIHLWPVNTWQDDFLVHVDNWSCCGQCYFLAKVDGGDFS